MKFKTDENLPVEAAATLRDAGLDAETVREEALTGADDTTIANQLRSEDRILVTLDLDFANIRAYPPEDHPGFIVLQLQGQHKANVVAVMKRIVIALGHRRPKGELWIVEEDRIRFRQGGFSRKKQTEVPVARGITEPLLSPSRAWPRQYGNSGPKSWNAECLRMTASRTASAYAVL